MLCDIHSFIDNDIESKFAMDSLNLDKIEGFGQIRRPQTTELHGLVMTCISRLSRGGEWSKESISIACL